MNAPGYDIAAVEEWVMDRVRSMRAPFRWTRLAGGHSNLTYRIDSAPVDAGSFGPGPGGADSSGSSSSDAGSPGSSPADPGSPGSDSSGSSSAAGESGSGQRSVVIRRPPLGKLLPRAHDMGREWVCISAMWGRVPVPEPLAFCEDRGVTGAPFYVMGLVDGRALYSVSDVDDVIAIDLRMRAAEEWIDTLADIHSLDIDEIGLDGLGKRDGYVQRQARTWYRSWTSSATAAGIDDPRIHSLYERLTADCPEQGPATVVHGDYGTHNVMFGPDARVAAVVDWEIATLGDPLADLGYSMNAWAQAGDTLTDAADAPSTAAGFPSRDHLVARYADRTGRDVSDLAYYRTFNRFKTACILHGVYARYRLGQKAISFDELEYMRSRVLGVIDDAVAHAEALWGSTQTTA